MVDECADVKGRSMKATVPWRSLFCGGDRKWGVSRCTTLGAGVGLAGLGEPEVTKTSPYQASSEGLFRRL